MMNFNSHSQIAYLYWEHMDMLNTRSHQWHHIITSHLRNWTPTSTLYGEMAILDIISTTV